MTGGGGSVTIKVKSAKAKAVRLQQWVRDQILDLFPQLEPDDCRSTSMGAGGEDIQLSPAARRLVPVSVECKANAKFAIYGPYEQAAGNAPAGTEPVVIIRGDRKKALAVIDAKYLLSMFQRKAVK